MASTFSVHILCPCSRRFNLAHKRSAEPLGAGRWSLSRQFASSGRNSSPCPLCCLLLPSLLTLRPLRGPTPHGAQFAHFPIPASAWLHSIEPQVLLQRPQGQTDQPWLDQTSWPILLPPITISKSSCWVTHLLRGWSQGGGKGRLHWFSFTLVTASKPEHGKYVFM